MVALAATGVVVIATAGAAAPAALAGAASGLGVGGSVSAAGGTMASAVAAGAVSGSVAGTGVAVGGAAVAGSTATAAATITGGVAGATTGSLFSGGMFAALSGPVGWCVLGAAEEKDELTFDCWKAIVKDTTPAPSRGRLLRDVAMSPMIKDVMIIPDSQSQTAQVFFHNVWDERFRIDFGLLSTGEFAAHAVKVE